MYFDLQVNGYAGVDFNKDELTGDELHRACLRLEADGVEGFLATVITDDLDAMCRRLRALATLRERDPVARRLIAGIHIEGPFINETSGFRGAHPRDAVRPADVDMMSRLVEAAGGLTKIVTLAPERDPDLRVTRALTAQGIVVSAGHCDPTVDQMHEAIDAGVSMFTHVGNGCPADLPRHDNIIQRVLHFSDRLWLTFIADGVHVPFVALGNYLRLTPEDRAIVVTDAIAPAGLGAGRYTLARWDLNVGEDLIARMPGTAQFVGSASTLARSGNLLKSALGLSAAAVRRLTYDNPRRAIGAAQ